MMISEQLPLRCQIVWNYFGVGVLLKRELCEEQLIKTSRLENPRCQRRN
jgi:hypothetical protein